jgi:hypothetical protein
VGNGCQSKTWVRNKDALLNCLKLETHSQALLGMCNKGMSKMVHNPFVFFWDTIEEKLPQRTMKITQFKKKKMLLQANMI